jgi:hypothetical protein
MGRLLVLAALVLAGAAPDANAQGGTPITTCGQVVKTNAFLIHNLSCPGQPGVVVGASGITINLNGFVLYGNRSFGRYGVDDMDGFDGVTVENGVVRDFEYGLVGFGADRLVLAGLVTSGNADGGIFVVGSSTQIQSSKASANGGDGIYVLGLSTMVRSSAATANDGNGIYLSGAFSQIQSSTASANVADGIVFVGNAARIDHNRTEANGNAGSTASGARRLGILVVGYTTAPTGVNIAQRNSDPAQCKPRSLCNPVTGPGYASPTVFDLTSRLSVPLRTKGANLSANLSDIQWNERVYTTSTSESVDVAVSTSYPANQPIGQRWADFFAALPHGPELERLEAYVAPLPEVQTICGASAVGCYGDNQLIITNEPALRFAPEEVARHEYGHHIALNRSNAPWPAFDWGPKRWATAARICRRVRWNEAYPGDESLLYKRNPGEAFAEAYRVLVDTHAGDAQPSWPLVDTSFYPDRGELEAVEQDVVAPWIGPTAHTFSANGPVWERRVDTPLDGTLSVRVTGAARLTLIGDDGRSMRPTMHRGRSLAYEVCSQRSVTIHVTTRDKPDRVDVRVTTP